MRNIIHRVTRIFFSNFKSPVLKIHSHPRSGTHFLEAFIAKNFYEDLDLRLNSVNWGHWTDRRINKEGNPYGKLFGNHYFPDKCDVSTPKIYIYRDGRAVAYSVWKTENFLNKKLEGLSFDEFLDVKIDWHGSPSSCIKERYTILEHWALHVAAWKEYSIENEAICLVRYEDLVLEPYEEYCKIRGYHFKSHNKKSFDQLNLIKDPVGLLPNRAQIDSWKGEFSEKRLEEFTLLCDKYDLTEYS